VTVVRKWTTPPMPTCAAKFGAEFTADDAIWHLRLLQWIWQSV